MANKPLQHPSPPLFERTGLGPVAPPWLARSASGQTDRRGVLVTDPPLWRAVSAWAAAQNCWTQARPADRSARPVSRARALFRFPTHWRRPRKQHSSLAQCAPAPPTQAATYRQAIKVTRAYPAATALFGLAPKCGCQLRRQGAKVISDLYLAPQAPGAAFSVHRR